jgi:hypothetical protein
MGAARGATRPPDREGKRLLPAAEALQSTLEAYDGVAAQTVFEGLSHWYGVDVVAIEIVPLLLRSLAGRRSEESRIHTAQREFVRGALEECLFSVARGWAEGDGPRAVLSAASGLPRELEAIGFGLALRRRGWRISYLGTEAPIETLLSAIELLRPRLAVVGLSEGGGYGGYDASALREVALRVRLALLGASAELAASIGATALGNDLIAEARRLSAEAVEPARR